MPVQQNVRVQNDEVCKREKMTEHLRLKSLVIPIKINYMFVYNVCDGTVKFVSKPMTENNNRSLLQKKQETNLTCHW